LDANLARQLGLCQTALLAQTPQTTADGSHFTRPDLAFLRHGLGLPPAV
jgi:hypothetical protein